MNLSYYCYTHGGMETCAGYDCTRATLCLASCQLMCYASAEEGPEIAG